MKLLQLNLQTTDTDSGRKLLCAFIIKVTTDLRLTICQGCLYPWSTDDLSIIIDTKRFALLVCSCSCICKLFGSLRCHGKINNNLRIVHIVCRSRCLGILDIRTGKRCTALCHDRINILGQHINHIAACIHGCLIVGIAILICFVDEIQGTGFAKLCQNGIGICYTGDLDIDPVIPLLIHNSFCTVILYTLLQLVDRICHILAARLFFAYCLIGDAHTACQIKTKLNV